MDNIRDAGRGSTFEVEFDSDSEVGQDERFEAEPAVGTREEPMVETEQKSVMGANDGSTVESGQTGVDGMMESVSSSGPVRFQLRTRQRKLHSLDRETLEELTGDPDGGPTRLRKPGRVDFPTITENEFLAVVDAIEKACQDRKWEYAFEMVDFLCARRCDERVMEMKAQLQMEVGQNFEAVKNCERAIKLNPRWWEGHRTHGRCLLMIGESALAAKAFERAIYINPADDDLRLELRSALRPESK